MATYYIDAAGNDANAGTSAGSGNSWLTLGKAASTVAAGDKVWVKNDQTYNEKLTLATSGTANADITWEGYATSTGDNGRVTIEGGNTRTDCIDLTSRTHNIFKNFVLQGPTGRCIGWTGDASQNAFHNCKILKGSGTAPSSLGRVSGFNNPNITLSGCEIANFTGGGVAHGLLNISGCEIHDNSGGAGITSQTFVALGPIVDTLIYDNGGDGILIPSTASIPLIANCTIEGNTGDGIELHGTGNSLSPTLISNNVIGTNGGYNINIANAPSGTSTIVLNKNFFATSTSGDINNTARVTQLTANVTLSGVPFTNAGSDDYSLDSTSGEGAAVRAAGAFNTFPSGNTVGYRDGGAVQHQDAGGGSGGVIGGPNMRAGMMA